MDPRSRKCVCLLVFAMMAAMAVAQNAAPGATDVPSINYNSAKVQPPSTDVTTSGGTTNTIPLFSTGTDIENSILTQTGTNIDVAGSLAANSFRLGGRLCAFG